MLGPPSAGKTSYLRTLSGRITTYPTPRTVVNGEITYNGRTFDEFVVRKTAAYVDEVRRLCLQFDVAFTMALDVCTVFTFRS